MRGKDLRCEIPGCKEGAANVALDYEFDPKDTAISWCCTSGHWQLTGWRPDEAKSGKAKGAP